MSIENYSDLADNIELRLDEADREARDSDIRYTHDDVFGRLGG